MLLAEMGKRLRNNVIIEIQFMRGIVGMLGLRGDVKQQARPRQGLLRRTHATSSQTNKGARLAAGLRFSIVANGPCEYVFNIAWRRERVGCAQRGAINVTRSQ